MLADQPPIEQAVSPHHDWADKFDAYDQIGEAAEGGNQVKHAPTQLNQRSSSGQATVAFKALATADDADKSDPYDTQ